MRPKLWTPNLRRSFPLAPAGLKASLLLWFTVGLLLPWLVSSLGLNRFNSKSLSFEQALEAMAERREGTDSNASAPFGEPQYGITQEVYDAWRQSQNQPFQSIDRMSQAEVRAIYQSYWQQGDCQRYESPLDLVCLDSLISFGSKTGKRLLVGLPDNPKIASLEVVRRRQELRQRSLPDMGRMPTERHALYQGTEHDQALAEFIQSYNQTEQAEFSNELRQWLASEPAETTANSNPDSADSIDRSASDDSQTDSQAPQQPSDRIYKQAKPFVMEVWVSTPGIVAPAAGIALTSDGLVLTNYHVINDATFDFVRSPDGKDYNGAIVEVDPSLDLALIQLEGATNLPTAKLADDSTHVKVGDTVYAIGSPLGSHWKMTEAEIIEVNSDCGLPSLQCLRTPEGFLKPGNSGGPLLDNTGQVVGVNRAIQDGTGEGVSIPIETVKKFVSRTQSLGGND